MPLAVVVVELEAWVINVSEGETSLTSTPVVVGGVKANEAGRLPLVGAMLPPLSAMGEAMAMPSVSSSRGWTV